MSRTSRQYANRVTLDYTIFPEFIYVLDMELSTYGHSQLKTGHPVRSAIHKQLNGRLVLRWVTTWESLLLYVLRFFFCSLHTFAPLSLSPIHFALLPPALVTKTAYRCTRRVLGSLDIPALEIVSSDVTALY
jgi:hypothetical protein